MYDVTGAWHSAHSVGKIIAYRFTKHLL